METPNTSDIHWSENVIIVDADYVDKVAFNLIVNFERMIGRRIPQADMPRWIDCIALDGGVREGKEQTQVVLVHDSGNSEMENFKPSRYADDLDGKAFNDNLGEFVVSSFAVEKMTTKCDYLADILTTVCAQQNVRRVMVVPNSEDGATWDVMRNVLRDLCGDKTVTMFAMEPMMSGSFRQEILGYSLMSALGIRADEIR